MVGAGGGSCLQSVDLHLTLLERANIFVYIQNFTRNVMGVGEGDGLGNDLDKIQFFLGSAHQQPRSTSDKLHKCRTRNGTTCSTLCAIHKILKICSNFGKKQQQLSTNTE